MKSGSYRVIGTGLLGGTNRKMVLLGLSITQKVDHGLKIIAIANIMSNGRVASRNDGTMTGIYLQNFNVTCKLN